MHVTHHVDGLIAATVALVNAVTPGEAHGQVVDVPHGVALADAIADAVRHPGYADRPSLRDARRLVDMIVHARHVVEALDVGDLDYAAELVNWMLTVTGTRPRLDRTGDGRHHLRFHGPDDTFAHGWAAWISAGLAMAIDGDQGHRLGVCSAPDCDRIYVAGPAQTHQSWCSPTCRDRLGIPPSDQQIDSPHIPDLPVDHGSADIPDPHGPSHIPDEEHP
ncbi:hypothetical protein KEM60_01139 [Austwickia sp. TVS 96-490-7B]|uniref:CGNR zinc finger domain-containing protein n=1 Tax=Austwickia sp. TVS 96-490-7B TaxID=2830843 RepID=UPI001C594E00|nr:CGNR zinc finger domain-containing protein [Austwickia sp. TVS 96-490-7B]MBW3084948.1 hypothetical protein [Austwickia sp. TVS 96-490-7B]